VLNRVIAWANLGNKVFAGKVPGAYLGFLRSENKEHAA
jgi:hypothetical protein